jgi:hypothetical protein
MTYLWRSTQLLGKTIFLIFLASLFSKPARSQTFDFQIMVNGPWDYVVDPQQTKHPNTGRRIVLVAPASATAMGHNVYVFMGDNAANFRKQPIIVPGLYFFDIDPATRTFAGHLLPTDTPPATYSAPQWVDDTTISNVLYKTMNRYAISLPAPDYYSEYKGAYGDGNSQAIVDINHITAMSNTLPHDYTTWMILHYQMKSNGVANLSDSDTGASPPVHNFPYTDQSHAISITMGVPGMSSETDCDSLSSDSFTQSKILWNFSAYARFPSEVDGLSGTQNKGDFHYNCNEAGMQNIADAQIAFERAQKGLSDTVGRIQSLKTYIESLMRREAKPANKSASDAVNDLDSLTQALGDLSFGKLNDEITLKLNCVSNVVHSQLPSSCSSATKYLDDLTVISKNKAAGGTDCHKGQTNINSSIP